jgi:hypothetical protein
MSGSRNIVFKVDKNFNKEKMIELIKTLKKEEIDFGEEHHSKITSPIKCIYETLAMKSIHLFSCENNNYIDISHSSRNMEYEEELIDIAKKIYNHIHAPAIGFDDWSFDNNNHDDEITGGDQFLLSNYDVVNFNEIFDKNIFTPKQVKIIGKSKLLSLSKEICSNIEEFEDGGILIEVNLYGGKREIMRNSIRKHLGMRTYEKKQKTN